MKIQVVYFASLKDFVPSDEEVVDFSGETVLDLFEILKKKYQYPLEAVNIRPAINDDFAEWGQKLENNDKVVFVPPVSGG